MYELFFFVKVVRVVVTVQLTLFYNDIAILYEIKEIQLTIELSIKPSQNDVSIQILDDIDVISLITHG